MTMTTALAPLARAWSAIFKADEGTYRPGPYYLPLTGGWLSADAGQYANWWQLGYRPEGSLTRAAMVEACISAYSQTIAMCPGGHFRRTEKGGKERISNSSLSRVLKFPNEYQSSSDFLLNAVRSLYLDGNAYALALRNNRYEICELHLMNPRMSRPTVLRTPEGDSEIFYRLGGNWVISQALEGKEIMMVPKRDVLHIHLHTDRRYPFPLIGDTPLLSALGDVEIVQAMTDQQMNFYRNQARPSAVLQTDLVMNKDQVQALRDRWEEQVKGLHAGGTPILTAGLKVAPWGMTSKDATIAETMKMSDEHIALAFRIPMQILGLGRGTTMRSTESLMQFWIATGLGFALKQVEGAYGLTFDLDGHPDEYVEFDTDILLRSALKDRMEALTRGVQGGVFSPNEARAMEGLPAVTDGEEPRLQAQVVPLSAANKIPSAPSSPAAPGPHAPPPATLAAAKDMSDAVRRSLLSSARTFARRRVA